MSAEAAGLSRFSFTVSAPEPRNHLYHIVMEIPPFQEAVHSFDLVMPVWAPGSYSVRDFSRNVRDLLVQTDSGQPVRFEKISKNVWRVTPPAGEGGTGFRVRYRVYANELTVRTSHLDGTHAYGNGTSLFFYVEGRKEEPHDVRFLLPEGWRVTIALPEKDGTYQARDYDELADSPFECGTHRVLSFDVLGKPHVIALWGKGNEDAERLLSDVKKIVETSARLFGGLPYERYAFLIHIAAGAGGGLEHKNSQSIGIAPWRFQPEKEYREVLYLIAHEFFHVWNVKRIRPAVLGPFDYTREVYTRDLWAMEGLTSYYEALLPVRAGLIAPRHAFEEWSKMLKGHLETPGIRVQSAEESSFDTWIRLYKPDENSSNVSESYYRRGALIGLALDLLIRSETGGKRSLDDVQNWLMARYGAKDAGYPEGGYETAVKEATGCDPHVFFDRYVRGTESPDLSPLLRPHGVELTEKPEKEEGEESSDEKNIKVKADFGWKTKVENGKLTVTEVLDGRAASCAGIDARDELVSVDGYRASEEQLKRIEREVPAGTPVTIHLFRRDQLIEIPLTLGSRRSYTYEIKPVVSPTPGQAALFESWLGQPFPKEPVPVPVKEERLE